MVEAAGRGSPDRIGWLARAAEPGPRRAGPHRHGPWRPAAGGPGRRRHGPGAGGRCRPGAARRGSGARPGRSACRRRPGRQPAARPLGGTARTGRRCRERGRSCIAREWWATSLASRSGYPCARRNDTAVQGVEPGVRDPGRVADVVQRRGRDQQLRRPRDRTGPTAGWRRARPCSRVAAGSPRRPADPGPAPAPVARVGSSPPPDTWSGRHRRGAVIPVIVPRW